MSDLNRSGINWDIHLFGNDYGLHHLKSIIYLSSEYCHHSGNNTQNYFTLDKDMTRIDESYLRSNKSAYYHCTRCCKEATPSCLRHKQQIELFYGSEIEKLAVWRQYQCNYCTKIGYSSDSRIICWFCSSTSVKLI